MFDNGNGSANFLTIAHTHPTCVPFSVGRKMQIIVFDPWDEELLQEPTHNEVITKRSLSGEGARVREVYKATDTNETVTTKRLERTVRHAEATAGVDVAPMTADSIPRWEVLHQLAKVRQAEKDVASRCREIQKELQIQQELDECARHSVTQQRAKSRGRSGRKSQSPQSDDDVTFLGFEVVQP